LARCTLAAIFGFALLMFLFLFLLNN